MLMRESGDGEPPDIGDEAPECLRRVSLRSFTASPRTVRPFERPVTLRWSATVPPGSRVAFAVNGQRVSNSGTLEVRPAETTTYTLTASARGASAVLGSRVVEVDTRACVSGELGEDALRARIERAVSSFPAGDRRVHDLSLSSFGVRSSGMQVSLHAKLTIDKLVDPDVYVDFVVGFGVDDGRVRAYYRRFTVDVAWPRWVRVLTPGVSKIVEAFVARRIEGELRPRLLGEIRHVVDSVVALLPDSLRVQAVRLTDGAVLVTVCPTGEGRVPARVVRVLTRVLAAVTR